MATTRTTVGAIKRRVLDAYREGCELGLVHSEAVERAMSLVNGMPRMTVEEWCSEEHDRRWEPGS